MTKRLVVVRGPRGSLAIDPAAVDGVTARHVDWDAPGEVWIRVVHLRGGQQMTVLDVPEMWATLGVEGLSG